MLRARVDGKRRDIGLGSVKLVTLAEARAKAHELRREIANGVDPVAEREEGEGDGPHLPGRRPARP